MENQEVGKNINRSRTMRSEGDKVNEEFKHWDKVFQQGNLTNNKQNFGIVESFKKQHQHDYKALKHVDNNKIKFGIQEDFKGGT